MFCQKCGNKLNDGAAFCPKCGTKVIIESNNTFQSTNNNTTVTSKKSNKKNFIIIGIVLLLFVFFIRVFGCSGTNNIENRLIGYWYASYTSGGNIIQHQLEFKKNGSQLTCLSYFFINDSSGNIIQSDYEIAFQGDVKIEPQNAKEGMITIIGYNGQSIEFSYVMNGGQLIITLEDYFKGSYGEGFISKTYAKGKREIN